MSRLGTPVETEILKALQADFQRAKELETKLLRRRFNRTAHAELNFAAISEVVKLKKNQYLASLPIIGFNGQIIRATILVTLIRALGCDVFVETGTFRGDTCLFIAAQTDLAIFTCDLPNRVWAVARQISGILRNRMQFIYLDSRAFLRKFLQHSEYNLPFFYLDAHWEVDIPLREELELILDSAAKYVIVIDDFCVPGEPGFGFDSYGGVSFNWEYIAPLLEKSRDQMTVFYPTYSSMLETGSKRGFIMIVSRPLASRVHEIVGQDFLKAIP
jgi:hypothetical protein